MLPPGVRSGDLSPFSPRRGSVSSNYKSLLVQTRPMLPLYPLRFRLLVRRHLWGGRRLQICLGKAIGTWQRLRRELGSLRPRRGPEHRGPRPAGRHGAGRTGSLPRPGTAGPRRAARAVSPAREVSRRLGRCSPCRSIPTTNRPRGRPRPTWARPKPGSSWPPSRAAKSTPACGRASIGSSWPRRSQRARASSCCTRFQPRPGDCLFIPAGTVHALGDGLLWPKSNNPATRRSASSTGTASVPTGIRVALHVEQGAERRRFPARADRSAAAAAHRPPWASRLVACDKFMIDRWDFDRAANDRRRPAVPYCLRVGRGCPHRRRSAH